jgi:hypothetical protein
MGLEHSPIGQLDPIALDRDHFRAVLERVVLDGAKIVEADHSQVAEDEDRDGQSRELERYGLEATHDGQLLVVSRTLAIS